MILPDAAMDLRPEGPLRGASVYRRRRSRGGRSRAVWFCVDPQGVRRGRFVHRQRELSEATGRKIRNESIEIEIDAATGGIRSLTTVGESTARLGQQLVMTGLDRTHNANPSSGESACSNSNSTTAGLHSSRRHPGGSLVDPEQGNRLASFIQRFRLWAGRPILEIKITLSDRDSAWLKRAG